MNGLLRSIAAGLTVLMLSGLPGPAGAQDQARRNELGIAFNHVSVLATGPLWERETAFWEAMGSTRNQPGAARNRGKRCGLLLTRSACSQPGDKE